jgi:DNA repair photolyase
MKQNVNRCNTYGTREWAVKTVNCCTGCSHDCVYCYAKEMALRFGQVVEGQWAVERIRPHDVVKSHPKYSGRVMFPSSHDITPGNLHACLVVLGKLLVARNEVLVVSKPHLDCIGAICRRLGCYRDQILFRFTIGACDDRVLSFWEPGAAAYAERIGSLQYAYEQGFQTSVSVEPMLESANIDQLVADLQPFVTDSIWIGKMNHLGRLSKNADARLKAALLQIEAGQTDDIIRSIFERYKGNPKIQWKASIKKVVGLPLVP